MLDVGCGAGQIAIPAAKAGAEVTGIDIAANLIEQARAARRRRRRRRAVRGRPTPRSCRIADGSFDLVVSLIGAMFAPRPDRVAAEMVRVCRPGGRIAMANWTPEGHVGQMFKIIGKHVPPPPLMPSPMKWGDEATVRERLGQGTSQADHDAPPVSDALPVSRRPRWWSSSSASTARRCARWRRSTRAGQAALRKELTQLWSSNNKATDGTTFVEAEYLDVLALRN